MPCHPPRLHRRRPAGPAARRLVAPATGLTLPRLPAGLTVRFEVRCGLPEVARFTENLVLAGLPFTWPADFSLIEAAEAALTDLCRRERGPGLAYLSLMVSDDVANMGPDMSNYRQRCGEDTVLSDRLSAFIVGMQAGEPHIATIGPALQALETWPRLGQTVLKILDDGLGSCVNSLNPRNGVYWASCQYWRGEPDETEVRAELIAENRDYAQSQLLGKEIKTMPTEAELDDLEIFSRKDYDAAIPRLWTTDIQPLKELPATLHRRSAARLAVQFGEPVPAPGSLPAFSTPEDTAARWPALRAACRAIRAARRADTAPDALETSTIACSPYLLRFADVDADVLIRIWDDTINEIGECGEDDLSVNAVFLFHDRATQAAALARLTNFLRLTRACENLIQLLSPTIPDPHRLI